MKKNRMMRAASALMVAVLMTTCTISGTFAKYVTSAEGTDTARVAKWGVTITANGETFAKTYAKDDDTFTLEANTVVSSDDDKVVAPGTDGTMAAVALSGTPEVAVRITYTGAFDINDEWEVAGDFYCPLVINVNGTAFDGRAYTSAADFELSVNNAIAAYSKDYPAGTDLSAATVGADALKVTWEWPFSTSPKNDKQDTTLGNHAVAGDAATVTLTVTTTATQID